MAFNKQCGNKKGAILPLLAIFIVFVGFGITALVVDAGMLYAEKKAMVTAADAGALAGAKTLQIDQGAEASKPKAVMIAKNMALSNGAITASAIFKDIKLDPKDKFTRQVIEVTAQVEKENYFAKLIGFDTTTVNAKAVATWGYTQEYDLDNNSFLPLYTYSSEFEKISDGAIQYGLHGPIEISGTESSPPNYGYIDVGSGNMAGVVAGDKVVEKINSPLYSFSGGHENLPNGVIERLINAYEIYDQDPETDPSNRKIYMTGLVPIIDTDDFESDNGIADIYAPYEKSNGWWDQKLTLPFHYCAYFIIEDVIIKGETKGVGASLYSSNYVSQYSPAKGDLKKSEGIPYLTGGAITIDGKTVQLYNLGGKAAESSILIGRFTGQTTELIVSPEDGDQNPPKSPGNLDAATYIKLIE